MIFGGMYIRHDMYSIYTAHEFVQTIRSESTMQKQHVNAAMPMIH